jgi:tetratricopeptide (TPR) repeat protein
MGVKRAIILFADIIGCSEVSNNCIIEQYDNFIKEFHEICVKTRDLLFPKTEYSAEEIESSIRGDEICLILHSGKDIKKDYFSTFDEEKDKIVKDAKNSILFAVGLRLMWLISEYNRERIKCSLLPRDLGIGINIGPVMFSVHPATDRGKSSEGYSINLAKRIEGVSREGIFSKIFVCKEFKYICDENEIPVEFDKGKVFELKGITTPPYLHEIKDIIDSKIVIESLIMNELQKLPKEDIELYFQTAKINEQEFWLRKLVGYLLLASKDKRAIELLKKEDVLKNLFEQANAYYFLGDFDKAISNYQKIREIDNKFYPALFNLGITYRKKGDFDKSLEYLMKALEINPKSEEVHISIGIIYRKKGDFDKSLEYLMKALEINPKSEEVHISIGIIYRKKGDFDKSLEYLMKALEINPKSEEAHISIGETYREKGDFDKSLEYLMKALEINPKSGSANYNLACIYCLEKNKEKASTFLREAIKLDKKYKKNAIEDDDFKSIKNEEEFKKLTLD